ncbi:MAG: VCBS repeat-containing protein, partial [Pyrinomonadaceae bacterium]|nr:VCBS repeat-containing protein [Pyrinomonadaceae bacterium]
LNNLGYSSTPWTQSQTSNSMTWNTETFAQNQNANAIRWGTMYNFRFRSNRPPQSVNATIGFYKTGDPITVQVQGPTPTSSAPPRSRADFDGDGKTDVSVFRGSEGNWYLNRSTAGFAAINWGLGSDVLTPGDFDGDNKTDTAIFRANPTNGQPDFYVLNSNGFTVSSASLGTTGDIPFVADYDGDSRADFCVRRPSDNTFYVIHANGTWYIAKSTDNSVITFNWGLSTDIPVFADYDGDNKDDMAVFRPSDGIWYIAKSSGGTTFMPFGTNGDVPVPGDYDGDGKDDQAVYRNGIWYMNSSTSGFGAAAFGLATDKAIPREYLP